MSNRAVLEEVHAQTEADIAVGRISAWEEPGDYTVAPPTRRFGVQQQSASGTQKIRCIDDYKESRINALCDVRGKIRMGQIAELVESARQLQEAAPSSRVVISKADFKSACRCIPIMTQHYPYAKLIVLNPNDGSVKQAQQYAMPFGSIGAVYAWDRVAHALTFLVRRVLLLPACRYVDDLFGVCYDEEVGFVRDSLLKLITMLGFKMEEKKTPIPASIQVVLGIQLEVKSVNRRGCTFTNLFASVEPGKALHWASVMETILQLGIMSGKEAEQLAGRLNFAAGAVAGRAGAARIRYIYDLAISGGGKLVPQARQELNWWIRYLRLGQRHRFPISNVNVPLVIVYTDAEGRGGVGGCMYRDTCDRQLKLYFSDCMDQRFTQLLSERVTQIIPLEAMAVAVAVEVFKVQLAGARCIFLIDNLSVLGSLRKGRCKAPDINRIICAIADRILQLSIVPFFLWVPSRYNLADAPSRGVSPSGFLELDAKKSIATAMRAIK